MKRLPIVIAILLVVVVLVTALVAAVGVERLRRWANDQTSDAQYECDPRQYPYIVDCPVEYKFEARCNPDALWDPHYNVDGPRRPVPANCTERIVHEFFRNLPKEALAQIANLDERSAPNRCSSTITSIDGVPTNVDASGYVFEDRPVLVVRLPGKHLGVPRDYEAFEWLGETTVVFEEAERETPHVRVHTRRGERLECLYNPFDMMMLAPYDRLKGAFICAAGVDIVKQFVVAGPMRPPSPR